MNAVVRCLIAGWVAAACSLLPAASLAQAPADTLQAIADEVYAWRLERDPQIRMVKGLPVTKLPRIDQAAAHEEAQFARAILPRLSALKPDTLTHSEDLFRLSLQHDLQMTVDGEPFHWLTFVVTPYQGGDIHQLVFAVLGAQQIATHQQATAYLQLVRDYGSILEQMREKTLEQRRRGILLPKPAIASAVELSKQIRAGASARLALSEERLKQLDPADARRVRSQLDELLSSRILPAIDRLQGVFDASYEAAAPRDVGLHQYPDGDAFYRHLIRVYTGVDLSAREIHEIGRRSLAQVDTQLDAIRVQTGFSGTRTEFNGRLKTDARWLAKTPEDVEARYMAFIRRIEPRIPEYFSRLPQAPYGVKRLDAAAEPGMTYGYYQQPSAADPKGYYRYNGSGLGQRTLAGAQHLIYHELIPGHHFQMALEQERTDGHPLRAFLGSGAYAEGWAEYAAGLAEEMQLYEPLDRYGHLMMRSFVATRLVVDTGLNAMGWSLEQGRDAMRHGTLESDAQIGSELLRYSTDIPGQALGYYLGYERMMALRERAQRELGAAFDLRAFNDALLASGSVPLNVLEAHIEWFIREGHKQSTKAPVSTSAQHIAALNTVTIRIERPASAVWAALFDRTGWMPAFVSKQHVSGPANATGDTSLYDLSDSQGNRAQRLEEVLLAVPVQRLVIRLAPRDGKGTYAVGDYRLTESRGATHLEFNVYWWEDIDRPSTADELLRIEKDYAGQTQTKIRTDIEQLKRFIETGARHASPTE